MKNLFVSLVLGLICLASTKSFCSSPMQGLEVMHQAPTAEEFVALRQAAGMKERKVASAEKGLPHSLFWVTLRYDDQLIGMGRVVGDGGTVAQITDIAVHPSQQRKGYGRFIFDQIQQFILTEIPDDAFVCLFAEKEIVPFYKAKGFELFQDKWPGMIWPCVDRIARKNTQIR